MTEYLKILVVEYVTGGGMRKEALPNSLASEGDMMLRALLNDLLEIPRFSMIVPRDSRLAELSLNNVDNRIKVVEVGPFDSRALWFSLLERCDAVWPIAPETAGTLENLCSDVEQAQKILLNSPSSAVKQVSSKIKTLQRLSNNGIAVVPTYRLTDKPLDLNLPWVIKPDDGVGCEGISIVRRFDQRERLPREQQENWIIQPLIVGNPMSLSLLCKEGKAEILSCNRMNVECVDDGFFLHSCESGTDFGWDSCFQELADGVASTFPTLWGYVGVDFLSVDRQLLVLEINPRLTTSYAGLRREIGYNPAAKVLAMAGIWGESQKAEGKCQPM